MKNKKPALLYNPNLIWSCSLDLREEKNNLAKGKLETKIHPENMLPPRTKPEIDNPEQTRN